MWARAQTETGWSWQTPRATSSTSYAPWHRRTRPRAGTRTPSHTATMTLPRRPQWTEVGTRGARHSDKASSNVLAHCSGPAGRHGRDRPRLRHCVKSVSPPRCRLRADPIACTGHGLCAELLPETIDLDEWGYPIIGTLPDRLLPLGRRAVADCPPWHWYSNATARTDRFSRP
ncbi:ferredoxin [Actinoallomurus vinaceus]|uniref:ferredoxin n=1 Tax=Actinoallomurus vinaceus TaxID=1080074 RepID=UPI003CD085AF